MSFDTFNTSTATIKPISAHHWLPPLVALIAATFFLDVMHYDLYLADLFYRLEGMSWSLKHSWLLEGVIHEGGRKLVTLLVLSLFALVACSYRIERLKHYRPGLWFLTAAVATSLLLVSALKGVTHIDCPWSLLRYGGTEPALPMDTMLFGDGKGRCFPAGHASGGYAWVALYFFFRHYHPRWRRVALSGGLLLGGVFGIAQQMRGAHFISHDVWTLAICWYVALITYLWLLRPRAMVAETPIASPSPT